MGQSGKWLTEAYHQHNPLAASGRAGVVAFFKERRTAGAGASEIR